MIAEVDDAARPHLRLARRDGPGRRHDRRDHVRPRRAARRPLARAEDRLVRHRVPRAADRPRPASAVRRDARHDGRTRSPSTSTSRRRSATSSAPTCRCSATAARSRRGSKARRPIDWRTRGAPRVRPPRPRQPPARRRVRRHAGGVLARGAPRRPREVRAVRRPPRVPADLLRHRRRSRAARQRAADPAYAPKVLDYAQRMLAWRMRHTERTLTGMKLTQHAGLVERRAARVR